MSEDERSAVLVIRIWREGPEAEELRARITHSTDVETAAREQTVAASEDEIVTVVRSVAEGVRAGLEGT
jgi:hypothetical protein